MTTLRNKGAVPATELRRNGSPERMVGRNKEINASSKKDLVQAIAQLVKDHEQGRTYKEESATEKLSTAQRREMVLSAYHSEGRDWAELGAALAGELAETSDREGFMRRLFAREEVNQGSVPRIRVRTKNSVAIVATSPMQLMPAFVRDKHLFPPEFEIKHALRVGEVDIAQTTGDLLEDKFYEAQEAMMVREDVTWKLFADNAVGTFNPLQIFSGGLTPSGLASMRNAIASWGIPPRTLLFATDVWEDFVGSTAFGSWFDPVSQYEAVLTGYLGKIMGLDLISDAYRYINLKVLSQGDMYLQGDPQFVGAFTDRGPIQSRELTQSDHGEVARGWMMWEIMSMSLFNGRGIVKGNRT
jgi:hypothetical protein